ncbi:MAG: L-seryl-tRNA(Sec) selenium transferase [Armatimonadota bacterium]|nr:L-seryl-tRNA(Sec) selenium transferase [Armatimonadota bacterium]
MNEDIHPAAIEKGLRSLPPVNKLLDRLPADMAPRAAAVEVVRQVLQRARTTIAGGGSAPTEDALVAEAIHELHVAAQPRLRPAINATGVILNTGLGRAVLAPEAVDNLVRVAKGHSTLEVDVETGRRGHRADGVTDLLRRLVGAEDAIVVNNNAAAVFLCIRSLAAGREVVISRGQLVEIGGHFRIPDVIASAGARMIEVGTTNKTHRADYEQAIGPDTALLLQVHPSNFRVVGFTESVPLPEMVTLGHSCGLAVMSDLGSGALVDLGGNGLQGEQTVTQTLDSGVDVCTWSGDKLLGGPQCGIIVGQKEPLKRMKRDPLMRALRVDKLILAALEATLRLYQDPEHARSRIPTLRAITRPLEDVQAAAARVMARLEGASPRLRVEMVSVVSQVGGGSLPGDEIPSAALSLTSDELKIDELARRLRMGEPAIFGRISEDRLLLDLRTVTLDEEGELAAAIMATGARYG